MVTAAAYDSKGSRYFGYARREIEPLLPPGIGRVLEIGCGTGATLDWLHRHHQAAQTAGVELTKEAAEIGRSVVDEVLIGDIETMLLDFEAETFDLILALDILEHLTDPHRVIVHLHSFLRPGGALIASIPNIAHYSVSLPLLARGRWEYQSEGLLDRTHLRFFVERTAVELVSCSGLAVDKVLYNRRAPPFVDSWPKWLFGREVRWYFPKLVPHLFNYQFLIRAINQA